MGISLQIFDYLFFDSLGMMKDKKLNYLESDIGLPNLRYVTNDVAL